VLYTSMQFWIQHVTCHRDSPRMLSALTTTAMLIM